MTPVVEFTWRNKLCKIKPELSLIFGPDYMNQIDTLGGTKGIKIPGFPGNGQYLNFQFANPVMD